MSKLTEKVFGCNLDGKTCEQLDEIAAKYGVSRSGGLRLAVGAAHDPLMQARLPFEYSNASIANLTRSSRGVPSHGIDNEESR